MMARAGNPANTGLPMRRCNRKLVTGPKCGKGIPCEKAHSAMRAMRAGHADPRAGAAGDVAAELRYGYTL